MPPPQTVFTGDVFGRLTVVRWSKENAGWLCKCSCGEHTYQSTSHLRNGNVLSCGCYRKECDVLEGWSATPTYFSFRSMHQRCDGDLDRSYVDKNIIVCDDWECSSEGFFNFLRDMGVRPEGKTLERNNNAGNYCKENCKWETLSNQCFNRDLFKNNKSGVTGVSFDKSKNKWISRVNKNGKTVHKRAFDTFEAAVEDRTKAAEIIYKEKLSEIRNIIGD